MAVLSDPNTWNKPPRERHAHVGDLLRAHLEGVSKAAQSLALYLFEYCIDGRYEWVDLYGIPLGEKRSTAKRSGERYARNTMREALKSLVEKGLVIVERRLMGGMFYLTVSHPGEKRPFRQTVKNLIDRSDLRRDDRNSDQIAPETREISLPFTENSERAKQDAAANENSSREKKGDNEGRSVASHGEKRRLHGSESGDAVTDETIDSLPDPDPARHFSPSLLEENAEAREILERVRSEVGITPQLKRELLNFTLAEVEQAIELLKEREVSSEIKNPRGFLVEALRGRWKGEKTESPRYPEELTRWYEWATEAGIVDGRPLDHCNRAATLSTSAEWVQVPVIIPPEERKPNDILPYRWTLWRKAIEEYPMPEKE